MVENKFNIVLFLIASDWLSTVIASKAFCTWFLKIVVKCCSQNLHMADMIPIPEVAPMVQSFSKEL